MFNGYLLYQVVVYVHGMSQRRFFLKAYKQLEYKSADDRFREEDCSGQNSHGNAEDFTQEMESELGHAGRIHFCSHLVVKAL